MCAKWNLIIWKHYGIKRLPAIIVTRIKASFYDGEVKE